MIVLFKIGNQNGDKFFINSNGNVGIGTDKLNDNYKLSVNGNIRAMDIKVYAVSNWYDNVFKPEYNLMPLEELNSFVKTHSHLPEIPSEKEVIENGYSMKDLNALLLKKVEELTLYVIELNEKNKKLEEAVEKLKK
jgi:hypothetical protein